MRRLLTGVSLAILLAGNAAAQDIKVPPLTVAGGGGLLAANNLSDVASAPTSLANLGGISSAYPSSLWGSLPSASGVTGKTELVTDVGPGCTLGSTTACIGSVWTSNGTYWKPRYPVELCSSAVAFAHTGDTTETTAATCTVPALAMGANGSLRVRFFGSNSGVNTNAKTIKVHFSGIGGTIFVSQQAVLAANITMNATQTIQNRGATNSQVGKGAGAIADGFGSVALVTSAVDTTANTTVVFTVLDANSGDTTTLESYSVEVLP